MALWLVCLCYVVRVVDDICYWLSFVVISVRVPERRVCVHISKEVTVGILRRRRRELVKICTKEEEEKDGTKMVGSRCLG